MQVVGRYINMTANVERRNAMQAQLERFGVADRYSRFPAIDGRELRNPDTPLSPGELGCFMSHYHCIAESAVEGGHLHIIEDDVVFGPQTVPLLGDIHEEGLGDWDIIFTDIIVPFNLSALFNLMELYRLTGLIEVRKADPAARMPTSLLFANLRPIDFTGAASYIVNVHSRHKIRRRLDREILRGPSQAIDTMLWSLAKAGEITALCTIPFLTTVDAAGVCASTISGRPQDPRTAMALFLLRSFFYVGKDEAYLAREGDALSVDLADPGYIDTMLGLFRFLFSEKFVPF